MTDLDHPGPPAFPDYTNRYLLGMTPGGRVLRVARKIGGTQAVLEMFQWQDGQVSDLGSLPEHGGASGWNSGGALVGTIADPPHCPHLVISPTPCTPGPKHAHPWQPRKTTLLGPRGGRSAEAWAINDRGEVVGASETARGARHAFLWQKGKMIDLSPRGTRFGGATAINERGQILEDAAFKKRWGTYLWQHGKRTELPHLFYTSAINNRGQVTGALLKPVWGRQHVVIWQKGKTTDLGRS